MTKAATYFLLILYFHYGICVRVDNSASIPTAKRILEEDSITAAISFIFANYACLSVPYVSWSTPPCNCESLCLLKKQLPKVAKVPRESGKAIANRRNSVLSKNTGFQEVDAIASILSGEVSSVDTE